MEGALESNAIHNIQAEPIEGELPSRDAKVNTGLTFG